MAIDKQLIYMFKGAEIKQIRSSYKHWLNFRVDYGVFKHLVFLCRMSLLSKEYILIPKHMNGLDFKWYKIRKFN